MRFINCLIYDKNFQLQRRDLVCQDGKIVDLPLPNRPSSDGQEHEIEDLNGGIICPGFLDIHIHGAMEADTMDADFDGLNRISRYLAARGITGFLPTTMTVAVEDIQRAFNQATDVSGAQVLGFNMEGPFISAKKRGAHVERFVRPPRLEEFELYKPERGIRVVTVAPEIEGALDFIEAIADRTVVSLGHTTADYDTSMAAIERGARSLTHTFNAMPPLLHRDPGLIAAAVKSGIHGEIIADTVHVHPAVIYCAWKLFGSDRLILISDSMRAAGLEDGDFELGGQHVEVKNGVARADNGAIAGGTSNVWACVGHAIDAGIPVPDALKMASQNPAQLIGLGDSKGSIAPGYDADFLVLRGVHEIDRVYIGGQLFEA